MNPATHLLRHAHPNFMDGDQISSQVFMPFPRDDGKLSVYDGDQMSAEESYRHYTEELGNRSHSVWAVTKAEADGEGAEAKPDPLPGFAAHSCVDFGSRPEKICRKIAKRLKAFAVQRGCQHLSKSSPPASPG